MKYCKDCQFRESQEVRDPQTGQYRGEQWVCGHGDCHDPVTAEKVIPCAVARQNPAFCGWEGRHFKKAEEPAVPPAPSSKVVQLVKP